jgi:hypothetical protein
MSSEFEMKLGPGRPITGDKLVAAVERSFDPALKRAALAMQAELQKAAPLGKTGNLRRSAATAPPIWLGRVRRVRVGFGAIYARRVNLTSKKNKGFAQRGFQAGKARAMAELQGGVRALVRELWDKAATS